jgi:hypothetical protein
MIEIILPLSLGEYSDQRHRFQQQVVGGIEQLLGEVEAALNKEVADQRTARDAAAAEIPVRDQEAADAQEKLNAKVAEVHRLKVELADVATAFRVARSALAEAEEAKVLDGQKARDAEKKKTDMVHAMELLTALKTTAPEECKKSNSELMSLLKKYKFEESMMIALPAALGKAPDARGQFDLMAINQLEGEINKLIAEQDAILAAAAPGQAACEAAIKQANDKLVAARGKQREAAKAFDTASKEQTACETAAAAAQKAVKDRTNLSKKLEKAVHNAECEVELYEQGARDAFKQLKERVTPPPVAEVEDEAAAQSPAADIPMVEEPAVATPAKELELPVAA